MKYPRRLYQVAANGQLEEPPVAVQEMWQWVERFQNDLARQNRSPLTIIEYGYDLAALIDYLQSVRLTSYIEVSRRTLLDYLDWMRLQQELSAVTLNRRLACVRTFFKFLHREEVIEHNPAADIPKARQRMQASHTYLLASEAQELLAAIDNSRPYAHRDRGMIALMLFCGLRVSEVAAMNIHDLRPREGVLLVRGKGNKLRELPLEDHLWQILEAYLQVRKEPKPPKRRSADEEGEATPMVLAKRQVSQGDGNVDALFISKHRRRISSRAIHLIVAKYMQTLELDSGKSISPHKLRHTFATLLYLNGADLNVLRELLGHQNLATTQIYAAVDQERKRKAMSAHPLLPKP